MPVASGVNSSCFQGLFRRHEPAIALRGIHLDLKGWPPAFPRLLAWMRLCAAARYNIVLVEWEDMFPWECDRALRCSSAFSLAQVKEMVACAKELGLELVPLVQTLGHMETPLRLPQYAGLRELPHDSYALNPLAPGAAELVRNMVMAVADAMPGIRRFHLGADEAWSLGLNPQTKSFVLQQGKAGLLRHHLEPVMDGLISRGIKPMLWHDMLIDLPEEDARAIARKAELMVWGYGEHPDDTTLHYNTKYIRRLHELGAVLWGATACKGASGYDSDLPDIQARTRNAGYWLDIHSRFGLAGIVATAWSRFSADNLQCEPFDAALDSLLNTGIILHDGEPPTGGIQACQDALASSLDGKCFAACHSAMTQMLDLRTAGWNALRMLREHLALAEGDPRRRWTLPCSSLRELRRVVRAVAAVGNAVRETFEGMVDPCWVDEYVNTRLSMFAEELALLEPRVKACTPPDIWEFEEINHNHPQ